jgi:CspA family cold shock protein
MRDDASRGRPASRTGRAPADRFEKTEGVNVTTGNVKKVVADRGFGFIAAEDGKEYFFHRDSLVAPLSFDRLNGGETVTFDVQASPKGPRATNVQAADQA